MANDLEKILYGRPLPYRHVGENSVPSDKERGLPLLAMKEPTRRLEDVILSDENRAQFDEILAEHNPANAMQDDDVQAKARAAYEWCRHATEHERQHGGKPWTYLLIPHDAIKPNMTLQGVVAGYAWRP